MNKLVVFLLCGILGACASKTQKKEALFEIMKENPEEFMSVLQETAELARIENLRRRNRMQRTRMQEEFKKPKNPKIDVERARRLANQNINRRRPQDPESLAADRADGV